MSSTAEREIRDYAAAFFRAAAPGCRVVHELNVGFCRADIAVVEETRLHLVEIKSRKDTLKRLERQMKTFTAASHSTIVIADERWFRDDGWPCKDLSSLPYPATAWRWPHAITNRVQWTMPRLSLRQPYNRRLLDILWKPELLAEAIAHGIDAKTRWTCDELIDRMAWVMTGEQISRAACRQLRGRPFVEADPPC